MKRMTARQKDNTEAQNSQERDATREGHAIFVPPLQACFFVPTGFLLGSYDSLLIAVT